MGEIAFGWNLDNSFDAYKGNGNEGLNS